MVVHIEKMRLKNYLSRLRDADVWANEALGIPIPVRRFVAFARPVAEGNGVVVESKLERFHELIPSNFDWGLFFATRLKGDYCLVTHRAGPDGKDWYDFNTHYVVQALDIPKGVI